MFIPYAIKAGPVFAPPTETGVGAVLERFEEHANENKKLHTRTAEQLKTGFEKTDKSVTELDARMSDVEKKLARRAPDRDPDRKQSWGAAFVESAEFKGLARSATQRGVARLQVKNITTATAVGLVTPDYREPVNLPQRPLTIRQLLAPGETSSSRIYYPRMSGYTNNAAPVAEGAQKPQSELTYVQVSADVQTIAHFVIVSRQIMDDAPALMSTIDTELRYGLDFVEETQLLAGDGTGANLFGILPQATAFSAPFTASGTATKIDVILQAIAQCEAAYLPCTGVVLHPTDWRQIMGLKDAGGNYLLPAGPFGNGQPGGRTLWDVPIAPSFSIPLGHFLVGPFADGAQIFDRMEAMVEISTEDSTNFQKNLVTVRGEKRLALAVKRPAGFITGTFG